MRRDGVSPWFTLASAFRFLLKLVLFPLLAYLLLLVMDHFVQGTLSTLDDALSLSRFPR